jgi:hypothetical protein
MAGSLGFFKMSGKICSQNCNCMKRNTRLETTWIDRKRIGFTIKE